MHQLLKRLFSSRTFDSKSMHSTLIDLGTHNLESNLLKNALSRSNSVSCHLFSPSGNIAGENDQVKFIIADSLKENASSLASTLAYLNQPEISTQEWSYKSIPYFPKSFQELSNMELSFLTFENGLEAEHPSFLDPEYRARRQKITEIAQSCSLSNEETPFVNYSATENETWKAVRDGLKPLHKEFACEEYNYSVHEMTKNNEFSFENIPQMADVNNLLQEKSQFRFFPVSGYITSRDFLTLIAFRVFPCTQYIRHHSNPFYTPEPDVVHDMIGHVPLFAVKEFADFSQQIGLASLGVSDADIKRLAACYLYTVEFGLVRNQKKEQRSYGAGMLACVAELLHFKENKSEVRFFKPRDACDIDFPLTNFQPIYWWNDSFDQAKQLMIEFSRTLEREFNVGYNPTDKNVMMNLKNTNSMSVAT